MIRSRQSNGASQQTERIVPETKPVNWLKHMANSKSYTHNSTGMRTSRFVLVAGSLLVFALVLGCGIGLWQLRKETLVEQQDNLQRLTMALAEQTERSFQSIDLVIEQTRRDIDSLGSVEAITDGSKLHQILKAKIFGLPQGQAILVFDADGKMIAHSREFPTPKVNVADRDYFLNQRDMAEDRLFVSQPQRNRVNGRWMVSLSRHFQVHGADTFGGVVMAAIEVDYFSKLYRALNLPDGVSIVLQRLDGVTLVQHPWKDTNAPPSSALGLITGTPIDMVPKVVGQPVLAAIQAIPNLKLAIGLLQPETVALDPWKRLALWISLGTMAAVGALVAFMGLLTNQVTKLEQRERQLHEAVESSRVLLRNASDGIHILDQNGNIVQASDSFCMMLGYDPDYMIGMNVTQWDAKYTKEEVQKVIQEQISRGTRSLFETQHRCSDGSIIDVEISGRPVAINDRVLLFNSSREITERKQIQQSLIEAKNIAVRSNAAKSDFLAKMSHEIRTPITAVLGMADLLRRTPLNNEQIGYLNTLAGSTRTLLTILNDILDISKIEAGQITLESIEYRPPDAVNDTIALFKESASQKGLSLASEIASNIPHKVVGDPDRLKQILFNLTSNAIKFTTDGRVTIRLSVKEFDNKNITLIAEVEDTGQGIAPEQLPFLFKSFSQLDASISRRFGGTGLGLAITKRLVEMMGGTIGVDSQLGKGSRFWFSLTFRVAPRRPTLTIGDAIDTTPQLLRPLRILLAEDNRINQMLVRTMLQKMGHTVEVADNGRLAVEAVAACDFDAVLMDMQMPEMNGEEATRVIRAMPPPKNQIPILALTADAMVEHRDRYLAAGINDLVSKPIDWDVLTAALARHTVEMGRVPLPLEQSVPEPA